MDLILEILTNHGIKIVVGFLFGAVGLWIGKQRALANWRKREFRDRLNISLNYVDGGTLRIRTVVEDAISEVLLSSTAVDMVRKAAKQTTPGKPILPLPEKDHWFVHNEVLNQLAERFSAGQLRKEMGEPVRSEYYVLVLTSEADGAVRTRKVRVMMLRRSMLKSYVENYSQQPPELENPAHKTRHETLLNIAGAYQANPSGFTEIELHV